MNCLQSDDNHFSWNYTARWWLASLSCLQEDISLPLLGMNDLGRLADRNYFCSMLWHFCSLAMPLLKPATSALGHKPTSPICPATCGAFLAARDGQFLLCLCMGYKHAEEALPVPENCTHFMAMPKKPLCHQLKVDVTQGGRAGLVKTTKVTTMTRLMPLTPRILEVWKWAATCLTMEWPDLIKPTNHKRYVYEGHTLRASICQMALSFQWHSLLSDRGGFSPFPNGGNKLSPTKGRYLGSPASKAKQGFYPCYFLVQKKDSSLCPTLDLMVLNRHLRLQLQNVKILYFFILLFLLLLFLLT